MLMVIGHRRLKWPAYVLMGIIVLAILLPIVISINKKHNSLDYKLEELGYNANEINLIKTLDEKSQNYILENKYNKYYIDLLNEKYYIKGKFIEYINFHNKNGDYELNKVVSCVNTNCQKEEYEESVQANLSNPYLVLVNKNTYLDSTYIPENLKDVSNWYAYEGRKLENTAYEAYIEMFNAAKEEDLHLILNNGYRSYESQNQLFEEYKRDYGERQADQMTTRAGFSEYQTGLALNIFAYYGDEDFVDTDEYTWLSNNAHKYGFILRYPKDKEYITKYEFESYHYRYVGIEVATQIYTENITLEEYHAYYLK